MWEIDKNQCKGCELCLAVCKPEALTSGSERNAKGYVVPSFEEEKCISCKLCDLVCPDMAITVTKETK